LLDLNSDRFLDEVTHIGGLAAGASYTVSDSIRLPRNISGPYYVL